MCNNRITNLKCDRKTPWVAINFESGKKQEGLKRA